MKTRTVVFDEYPDDEVVLRVSGIPQSAFWALLELEVTFNRESFGALADALAPWLVSWTFPHPADAQGLREIDLNLALALRMELVKGVRDVPLPLPLTASVGTASSGDGSPQP